MYSLDLKENVLDEVKTHTSLILALLQPNGQIVMNFNMRNFEIEKGIDIVRQSMAICSLQFANYVLKDEDVNLKIFKAVNYLNSNFEKLESIKQFYCLIYLSLGNIYSNRRYNEELNSLIDKLNKLLSEGINIFGSIISAHLYCRLYSELKKNNININLLNINLIKETLIYILRSNKVSKYRFFDHCDLLVWSNSQMKSSNIFKNIFKEYLSKFLQSDGLYGSTIVTNSSVNSKIFESMSYEYHQNEIEVNRIYATLMSRSSPEYNNPYLQHFIKNFPGYIRTERNSLYVHDTHVHILIGLCYIYEQK